MRSGMEDGKRGSPRERAHIQAFFAIALALVLATTARAQDKDSGIGPPVTCVARGYWTSTGDAHLVIHRLNQTTGAASIEGFDSNGIRWTSAATKRWVFKDGVLEYNRDNKVRYRLVVKEMALTGSYSNAQVPQLSRDNITYQCDGPIDRVIVRQDQLVPTP